MPRFSVIVPVYKVQGYLRECLDSVLTQSFPDLEVIGVNDCSPDGSGAILDEYAARDPRVHVLHLPRNVGLGRARNAGVARASGEYLLFLDSDDSLLPGALGVIDARLTRTQQPELLVFDHVRSYWWGKIAESVFGELLASAGTRTFDVASRPEYLYLFAVAWNKAYRRDFYLAHDLTFTAGLYEDAPVTYQAMVSASRIACLDQPCVAYRQRRKGAITRTPGRGHFDIFPQYAGLWAFLDSRPDLGALQPVLFERMISHFLFIPSHPERLRPADRGDFFRTTADFYRRYKPAEFTISRQVPTLEFQLVSWGWYPAFALYAQTVRVMRAARIWGRRARTAIGRRVYRGYYFLQRRLPMDRDLAVYTSYWNRTPACSPAAIHRKATEICPRIRGVWVVRRDCVETMPPGVDHVLPGSRRYWKLMARARYFINNVNFPNEIVKRRGSIHVQTHHGTPLKKMGLDQQQYPAAASGMSFRRLLERADRWDFSITANQHTTEVWERVYPCDYETVESGYPRNDVFFTATAQEVLRIRAGLGIAEGKTAVLYAPTHRDYQRGFVPRLAIERLCQALGPDYVLLVRAHYFYPRHPRSEQFFQLREQGRLVDVTAHPSAEELCLAADALLTDYSSIMFDYANLDRPIVVYADDWETYQEVRGVYFNLISGEPGETPGLVATTEDQLIEVFRSGAWEGERAATLRAAFRKRFCQFDDGRAAERIVRRVFLGERLGHPAVLPPEERHPAPSPRQALLHGGSGSSSPIGAARGEVDPASYELLTPERPT